MLPLLRILPRNALSLVAGKMAYVRLPRAINTVLLRAFIRRYKVNVEEAERAWTEYRSLGEFFVRRLKPGARPTGEGLVSPVDGIISQAGRITGGRILQVKGIDYAVDELLGGSDLGQMFRDGAFATLYLAPPDYHHIHAPADGRVTFVRHIEGTLWPVNEASVSAIRGLFTVNERVAALLETKAGRMAMVAVGATNVGSIGVDFLSFRTNASLRPFWTGCRKHDFPLQPPVTIRKGDRIGTFHLGSTVILLAENGAVQLEAFAGKIKTGMTLGKLLDK